MHHGASASAYRTPRLHALALLAPLTEHCPVVPRQRTEHIRKLLTAQASGEPPNPQAHRLVTGIGHGGGDARQWSRASGLCECSATYRAGTSHVLIQWSQWVATAESILVAYPGSLPHPHTWRCRVGRASGEPHDARDCLILKFCWCVLKCVICCRAHGEASTVLTSPRWTTHHQRPVRWIF